MSPTPERTRDGYLPFGLLPVDRCETTSKACTRHPVPTLRALVARATSYVGPLALAAALLFLGALPAFAQGYDGDEHSVSGTARIHVPPVLSVRPTGPLSVVLTTKENARPTEIPRSLDATGIVSVACAANVVHDLMVEATSLPASGPDGRVEWRVGDRDWAPLTETPSVVLGGLPPGRRPDCAAVEFRQAEDQSVRTVHVVFTLRPRPRLTR